MFFNFFFVFLQCECLSALNRQSRPTQSRTHLLLLSAVTWPTNARNMLPPTVVNSVSSVSDTCWGFFYIISCSFCPPSPPWFVVKCSQWFGPCWKLCIYIFSRSLSQRSSSSHVQMDLLQLREHIICCSNILPPPPPPPLIDGMISITIIHFSLHQAVISSVHASAREISLLFYLCGFSGRKFPGGLRRCRPTRLCPDCFYQRLTGCSWGTKHCCSNVRFCWIPLVQKGHTWKLRSATSQFHAFHSSSSQTSHGLSHVKATHKSTISHIPVVHKCKCISNLSPFYICSVQFIRHTRLTMH